MSRVTCGIRKRISAWQYKFCAKTKFMKNLTDRIVLLLIFLVPLFAMAQSEDPCHKSTEGKDFWFGFMESRNYHSGHYVEVTMTSPNTCHYEITIGKSATPYQNGTLYPDSPQKITIDWNLVEATGSEQIQGKAIHLTSDQPMNVYALNYDVNSADVALIFPTSALGNEYYAACYDPHIKEDANGNYADGRNSEFLVVATEDNTTVTIVPSKVTDQLKPAGVPFVITLDKGEVYQVQSMNHNNLTGQGDLTGSYITSDKPIAFFSGSLSTTVPADANTCCWDHLYEQIPPVQAWGTRFMAVPLKTRQQDTYRIIAAYDNTSVKVGNTQYSIAQAGGFREFSLSNNDPRIIESTKPILLVQYSNSRSTDEAYTGGNGDPFMIVVSPLVQTKQNVTFVAYSSSQITTRYFVNVVAKDVATSFISLDGASVSFTSLPGTGYSYAQVSITQGNHKLVTSQADKGFIAYVYGFGGVESYGYGVGFNLDIQLDLGFSGSSNDTLHLCAGSEVKLEAGAYFDKYQWNTGDTIPFILVSKDGFYKITATTLSGCELSDSVYVKISNPKIDLGDDTSSCGPGKIVLDAGPKFKSYLWSDGSTGQKLTVNQTGDYWVVGTNEYDCQASDTVHVDVYQVPEVQLVGDTLMCGVFNSILRAQITNADSSIWNYTGAAQWTASPSGLTFEDVRPDKVTIKAGAPGNYTVNYVLTTLNKCQVPRSFKIGFFNTPESAFTVESPESTDKCASYERIVTYTGTSGPTAKFDWDFGGLMVLDTIGPNQFKISIGANNPSRTLKLVVNEHGCTSPETTVSVGVNPIFKFWADEVHGCDSMCVQFRSKVDIPDSVSYHWEFGDDAGSSLKNPVHCYRDTGKYDVSLLITNLMDGCRAGSVEPEMIQIFPTPKAVISADPNVCYDDTVQLEYLNAKSNSLCKWFGKGNEIISNDNINATYELTDEVSQIGFLVEEDGCACDTLTVLVKRKPHFDFITDENEVCLPDTVAMTAIAEDPNLQFSWSLDTLAQVPGNLLKYHFQQAGFYAVTLDATSGVTGCSASVTKPDFFHVYPLPEPAFTPNYPVATLDHPDITFANQSQGAVSFLWNFGDGATSDEASPLHKYADVGDYRVILQAFTDFGCADTISSLVQIVPFSFYVPNAFRPDSDIPDNRVFLPIREGVDPSHYEFKIFNRVGSTIFESKNPETGWDGKQKNGKESEPGVYVWIVNYADIQGYSHTQKGTVMLVR